MLFRSLASHYLAPLSKVQLTIVLPRTPGAVAVGQEFVKCDGIVVRCDQRSGDTSETPYELACMFTGLDRDLRQRIEEFVTWRNLQALRAALSAPEGKATKPSSSRLAVKQAVVRKAAPARASARNGRASTASARRAVAKRTAKPARKAAVNAAKPSAKSTGKQAAKASAGRARR